VSPQTDSAAIRCAATAVSGSWSYRSSTVPKKELKPQREYSVDKAPTARHNRRLP
jgi:hypothetical protein